MILLRWNALYTMYLGNDGGMYTEREAQALVASGKAKVTVHA